MGGGHLARPAPDAVLVVVAADTQGLAEESLPGIERRLAAHGTVSGWRLTPALQVGVVSLQADQSDIVLAVLRDTVRARTGVSPPYRSLTDTPRALQLARTALDTCFPHMRLPVSRNLAVRQLSAVQAIITHIAVHWGPGSSSTGYSRSVIADRGTAEPRAGGQRS